MLKSSPNTCTTDFFPLSKRRIYCDVDIFIYNTVVTFRCCYFALYSAWSLWRRNLDLLVHVDGYSCLPSLPEIFPRKQDLALKSETDIGVIENVICHKIIWVFVSFLTRGTLRNSTNIFRSQHHINNCTH